MSRRIIALLCAILLSLAIQPSCCDNLSTDESSLIAFKSYVTSDPKNILSETWSESAFVCDWTGVACGGDPARVVGLNLSYAGLVGTVPPHLGNLSALVHLRFRNNTFRGVLPSDLSRLGDLAILDFGDNDLTGEIPPWLGSLSELEGLALDRNRFSGSIPIALFNATSMRVLDLSNNELSGTIPGEIRNLRNLRTIDLTLNQISGFIPPSLFNITTIKIIALNSNNLSGSLPDFSFLPNLEELYVGENKLNGSIPKSISNASYLHTTFMSINHLSGIIPHSLSDLKNLQWISFFGNDLTIESRTLSTLATLTKLRYISLSFNPLNVTLPTSIGLNGSKSLEQLYMSICNLKGKIPTSIGNLSSLIALNLRGNRLGGTIPSSIGGLQEVQVLYLHDNMLHGIIPSQVCVLQTVYSLNLRQNTLSGSIPSCFDNMTSLRKVSLASNNLTSEIPPTIWSLRDLSYMDLSSNSLTGSLSPEIKNMKVLGQFSVANNQLSGIITGNIGHLKDLTILHLSKNEFNGSIPSSIGNASSLEDLDLSNNSLSGVIPKSFEKLSHLKLFNISFNKLYGEIPSGGPFAKLSSRSFIHNSNLCGPPRLQVPPCISVSRKANKASALRWIIPVTIIAIVISMGLILILFRRKKITKKDSSEDALIALRRVSRLELSAATNGFNEENLIGAGSFGSVYKGTLSDGLVVAIKVFNLQVEGAFESFAIECEALCNIRHKNLVKVITCCSSPDFKALVLQYIPHGNLDQWLYSREVLLKILQRLNVMIDVASALEYLHYSYSTPIVHCDLKPSNVLIDEQMVAHVADFGLSKLLFGDDSITHTTTLATIGYMAPEYGREGVVSRKGDVFSFGIMLMEVFTKKKPVDEIFSGEMNMKQWVESSLQHSIIEAIDVDLLSSNERQDLVKDCVSSILELALACSASLPEERIDMKTALSSLKKIKMKYFKNNN